MTTFTDATGSLLDAKADALVNTVNTVGVMGKGIALQFKNAYPAMFKAYAQACKRNEVRLGEMWVFDAGQLTHPRWIVNFPTKDHWRSKSRLRDINEGLDNLRRVIKELGITSIAIPPLGCGNGGLEWSEVRPLIEQSLVGLETEVLLFAPTAAPKAAAMRIATERPKLTYGKAALVSAMNAYDSFGFGTSLIEAQKVMYFVQEAGEELDLRYERQRYGPYADNLRHLFKALEGHHLRGFGDGSLRVQESEPIEVLPGAAEESTEALAERSEFHDRLTRVLELARGYESPYGMELLATVHWVMTREVRDPDDLQAVIETVQSWNPRKARMFTAEHVAAAWGRLRSHGWAGLLQPA